MNVITLSLILLLAGCFGLGDSAEAAEEHEHTPNAAPVLHAELTTESQFNLADCTITDCNFTVYHAAVDPDGDTMELGFDFNLDGNIDQQLTNYRGYTNIQIPKTEFIETVVNFTEGSELSDCVNNQQLVVTENTTITELKTTIALIAVDTNDAASGILLTTNELYENSTTMTSSVLPCTLPTWQFDDRDAAGSMSSDAGDALVHVKMTQGDDLSWSVLRVSIVVDGGNSFTCVEAAKDDGTADCTYTTDDDNDWSTSEEITISEGDMDMCDGADGGCDVDVTLTKIGVGNEDDKVIREVSAYADANA